MEEFQVQGRAETRSGRADEDVDVGFAIRRQGDFLRLLRFDRDLSMDELSVFISVSKVEVFQVRGPGT